MLLETKTLKIDTAFAGLVDREFEKLLSSGWSVKDKTVVGDRYIYYVLSKRNDYDVGKTEQSHHA